MPFILFLSLITASLFGQEEPMKVNSGEAEYNGREISLVGDVVVQHGLGKISAHRFTVTPSDEDKKNKFSNLSMSEDVEIEFQGGGKLRCETANVDYEKLHGTFLGNPEKPDVVYTNWDFPEESLLRPQLIVKGDQFQVDFIRPSDNAHKVELDRIQIDGNVRVQYNQDYYLKADQAFYQRNHSDDKDLMSGTLLLTAKNFCEATNQNGDQILAKKITVDVKNKKIILFEAQGALTQHGPSDSTHKLKFASSQLILDDIDQSLHLNGNVTVNQDDEFYLKTDHAAIIDFLTADGKRVLRSLKCPKESELAYHDLKKESLHSAKCFGMLFIDHENSQIWMYSPKDPYGNVPEGKQVFFDDLMGEISADEVHVTYEKKERQMMPLKVDMAGHVQIFNRFDGHVQESSSVLQYTLADRMEYIPALQDMTLSGENGNRVLFFDKINSLQMSAPALKIHFDKTTMKESIQGMGDVRFTFIEREFNQLKSRFRFNEKSN